MDLGTVLSSVCHDLETIYSVPFEARLLPDGEGDHNFEIVPGSFDYPRSICAKVYLYYGQVVFELGLLNAAGIVVPVFRGIQRKLEENSEFAIELEAALIDKGCNVKWVVNQKPFGAFASITEIIWDIVSLRVESPFIPVYSRFDIHYEVLKEFLILFSGLVLAMSDYKQFYIEESFLEGGSHEMVSSKYERNPLNRALCISKKGYRCSVCGLDMGERYGEIGRGYIEVHHAVPVSTYTIARKIDLEKELFPLCPNCHAMVHRRNPPYSIEELKDILKAAGGNSGQDSS